MVKVLTHINVLAVMLVLLAFIGSANAAAYYCYQETATVQTCGDQGVGSYASTIATNPTHGYDGSWTTQPTPNTNGQNQQSYYMIPGGTTGAILQYGYTSGAKSNSSEIPASKFTNATHLQIYYLYSSSTSKSYGYVNSTGANASLSTSTTGGMYEEGLYWVYSAWAISNVSDGTWFLSNETIGFNYTLYEGAGYSITDIIIEFDGVNYTATIDSGYANATITAPNTTTSQAYTVRTWINYTYSGSDYLITADDYDINVGIGYTYGCADYDIKFVVYNEETGASMNGSHEITLDVYLDAGHNTVIYQNLTTTNVANLTLCFDTEQTLYVDSFHYYRGSASPYTDYRQYFLRNATITDGGKQNISLYTLNESKASNLQITLKDTYLEPISDTYLYIKRYYPGENAYKTVAMVLTDENGQGNTYVQPNDIYYRITADKDYEEIKEFSTQKIYCTTTYCTLTLTIADALEGYYETYSGYLTSSCSWTNTTGTISCSYVDSSGLMQSITLDVYEEKISGKELVCSQNSTSSAATLNCVLGNSSITDNHVYTYYLRSSYNPTIINEMDIIDLTSGNTFGEIGLFISWAVLITVGLIGLFSPGVGVIMLLIAVPTLVFMNLLSLGIEAIFGIIIIGVVIYYRVRS